MMVSIILVLVLISFVWNIAKKNKVWLNILMSIAPIVLTIIAITYTCYNPSITGNNVVMDICNLICCTCGLILSIIGLLILIKDRKIIKTSKSFLLIGMVLAYCAIMHLSLQEDAIFISPNYLRIMYISNMSIGLLLILQINLFINLISNNKKVEKDKKEEK